MLKVGYLEENYHYFHLKDTAGNERDYHYHDFDKIVILLSGHVDYAVESDVYSLKPYEVLLVKHHTIHKAIVDKSVPYERIIIYLNEGRYSSVMPEAGLTQCFDQCLYLPERDTLSNILNMLEQSQNEVIRETYVIQLLAILNSMKGSDPEEHYYDQKTEEVLTYINENLESDLSVETLSEMVHLSKYYFMRQFKKSTGQTVHSYVRQQRLFHASRLIRQGTSVSEAARRSGFEDYSVFYKAFKENFGFSPKEIKK